jgi:hypothetical protein
LIDCCTLDTLIRTARKSALKYYCKIGVEEKFLVPQITIHKTGDVCKICGVEGITLIIDI